MVGQSLTVKHPKTKTLYDVKDIVLGISSLVFILASMGLVTWFGVVPAFLGFSAGILTGIGSLIRREKPIWVGLVGAGVSLYGIINLLLVGAWPTIITTFFG